MRDADRELHAVYLGERRRVEVLRVVAHREDRGVRLPDALALDEVRLDPGRVVDAHGGQVLGDETRALRDASISRTSMPCSSSTRAIAVPTRPAP